MSLVKFLRIFNILLLSNLNSMLKFKLNLSDFIGMLFLHSLNFSLEVVFKNRILPSNP